MKSPWDKFDDIFITRGPKAWFCHMLHTCRTTFTESLCKFWCICDFVWFFTEAAVYIRTGFIHWTLCVLKLDLVLLILFVVISCASLAQVRLMCIALSVLIVCFNSELHVFRKNSLVDHCGAPSRTQVSCWDKRGSISQTLLIRQLKTPSSMVLVIRAGLGHLCRIHGTSEERHLWHRRQHYTLQWNTAWCPLLKKNRVDAFYFDFYRPLSVWGVFSATV